MAMTANHPDGSSFVGAPAEPDEDIAAIAKQISDHAEVIYQTWKARGLAPNEILTCHNNLNAADKFGSVLTSTFSSPSSSSSLSSSPSPPPSSLLSSLSVTTSPMSPTSATSPSSKTLNGCKSPPMKLASPSPSDVDFLYGSRSNSSPTSVNAGNLENFVNKFVDEDKARLASRQKLDPPAATTSASAAKNYPSSIQYALQKFERRSAPTSSSSLQLPPSADAVVTNCAATTTTSTVGPVSPCIGTKSNKISNSTMPLGKTTNDFQLAKSKSNFSPTKTTTTTSEKHQQQQEFRIPVVIGTNNMSHVVKSGGAGGSVEADGSIGCSSYASNTSTWPLKTKSPAETMKVTNGHINVAADATVDDYMQKCRTLPSKIERRTSAEQYLDEVAKEEERLINALKTGMVITANEVKMTFSPTASAKVIAAKPSKLFSDFDPVAAESRPKDASLSSLVQTKTRPMSLLNEKIENCRRTEAGSDTVCGATPKRNRRLTPGDAAGPLEPSINAHRLNWRANSSNIGAGAGGGQSGNPVRPFLTRGSVAERVMMFEKCPTEILEKRTKTNGASSAPWKNLASDVHTKIQNYSKEANQRKGVYPPHTTLQRHTKANKNVFIPRFHYPYGKPINQHQQSVMFKNIEEAFQSLPNLHATKEQFSSITKACGCPLYWKAALFIACGGEKLGFVEINTFLEYWRDLTAVCHDDGSRFMRIVTRATKRSYIIPEDLIPLVQDVVNTHPGLAFLKQAPEFHSRYVHTVICRVYYCVNQSWNGQISLAELRKSDFLRAIQLLEEEEDINQVTAYFSYEHFYVIYCKFWELDRDHDLFISKNDLARHSDHALSTRIIDRIFSRTRSKSRNSMLQEGKMSYTDFVIFLLAEEDKRHPRAIEYWFRCMDLDGDGFLSMYELEYFYDEQLQRMEAMGIECLPFEDCLCQMLDMIQPRIPGKIALSDLKKCKMTPIFFDTFFNLEKYLDHEQRDPFASQRDHDSDLSDWDRYAAEEYELLVAEESGNDHCEDVGQYQITENTEEDDIFSSNLDDVLNGPREYVNHNSFNKPNNNYLAEKFLQPRMMVDDYGGEACHSDSSDDYAGDSDDCSL